MGLWIKISPLSTYIIVFKFLHCLVKENNDIKFLLALLKTVTDSNDWTGSRIRLFPLPFSTMDRLSKVSTLIEWMKNPPRWKIHFIGGFRQIILSQAAFGTIFRVCWFIGGCLNLKPVQCFWKGFRKKFQN